MAGGKEDGRDSHSTKERGCPLSYLSNTRFRTTNLIYTQLVYGQGRNKYSRSQDTAKHHKGDTLGELVTVLKRLRLLQDVGSAEAET